MSKSIFRLSNSWIVEISYLATESLIYVDRIINLFSKEAISALIQYATDSFVELSTSSPSDANNGSRFSPVESTAEGNPTLLYIKGLVCPDKLSVH